MSELVDVARGVRGEGEGTGKGVALEKCVHSSQHCGKGQGKALLRCCRYCGCDGQAVWGCRASVGGHVRLECRAMCRGIRVVCMWGRGR